MVGLRPHLSATPPRNMEPMPMPHSSADSTTPSAARGTPHSLVMPGAANGARQHVEAIQGVEQDHHNHDGPLADGHAALVDDLARITH